jgi:hypothetical protein
MTNERTLRHPNGGALKIGVEVHVSADSFCDEDTKIFGTSAVIKSTVRASTIANVQVFSSQVSVCHATGSVITESRLDRLFAADCVLDRVLVCGAPETKIELIDVVAENCELHGTWRLEGNARIPTGTWYRPPRYLRITGDNGVDIGLTESTDGHALMACWRKPITTWLKAGPRLGIKHGWSSEQIEAAKQFYESLLDCPMET